MCKSLSSACSNDSATAKRQGACLNPIATGCACVGDATLEEGLPAPACPQTLIFGRPKATHRPKAKRA